MLTFITMALHFQSIRRLVWLSLRNIYGCWGSTLPVMDVIYVHGREFSRSGKVPCHQLLPSPHTYPLAF